MQYTKTLTTKTGSELYLRNGDAPDGMLRWQCSTKRTRRRNTC